MKSLLQTIISILTTFTLFLSMLGITFNKTSKTMWNNSFDMTDLRYQVTYHEKVANTEKEVQYQRDDAKIHYESNYFIAGVKVVSVEQYYTKEDANYYCYTKNLLGTWTKSAVTEDQYNDALNQNCVCDFKGVFDYNDFEYNDDTKYYKASKVSHTVSDSQTDIYEDITIKFVNNRITYLNATQVNSPAVTTKTLDITYTSLPIVLPVISE